MNDYEIVSLDSTTYKDFFKTQAVEDVWEKVLTREIYATPLENNELNLFVDGAFAATLPNGYEIKGFAPDVTDDGIRSTMETVKTSVAVPLNDKWELYPLRFTAFNHLQDRAGITGRTINGLKDRARSKELPPATRCVMLNEGLRLYNDYTLVLIRDGKISSLLSGDENDYAVMPAIDLINKLETAMDGMFENYEMKECKVSHEIAYLRYDISDSELQRQIRETLMANGQIVNNVNVGLVLSTSDVGLCAARLTPVITVDGVVLPVASAKATEHKGGSKALPLFCDNISLLLANYRKTAENLNRLLRTVINNPVDCLSRVVEAIKLVGYGSALKEAKEVLLAEHSAGTCTGYDIYWHLLNALIRQEEINKQKQKTASLFATIKAQETVAQVLFINLTEFDY